MDETQIWHAPIYVNHDDVIKWKHFCVTYPLCEESTVTCGFPSQRPVTRSFDVFFNLRLNKQLSKHSRRRWFKRPSRSLWRHCNGIGTRNPYHSLHGCIHRILFSHDARDIIWSLHMALKSDMRLGNIELWILQIHFVHWSKHRDTSQILTKPHLHQVTSRSPNIFTNIVFKVTTKIR